MLNKPGRGKEDFLTCNKFKIMADEVQVDLTGMAATLRGPP